MENASPLDGRPWVASYAAGVPADVDDPGETLPQMLAVQRRALGRPDGAGLLRRDDVLRRPRGRRAPRCGGAAASRGAAAATGSRSCCPTARSTSSRSTPSCAWARSSSSTTRCTRPTSCSTSSPTRGATTAICWDLKAATLVGLQDRTALDTGRGRRPDDRAALAQPPGAAAAAAPLPGRPRRDDRAGAGRRRTLGAPRRRRRSARPGPRAAAPRRHRPAPVHDRHDRPAQGRRPQPPQPARQRRAGPGLDAGAARRRGDRVRRPAAVPRLRADALPHVRDEHRRDPRALPAVRRRPGARRDATPARDVPARRPADLPPARRGRRRAGRRPRLDPVGDLGGDGAAAGRRRALGAARPADCSSRATG